MKGKDLIRYIVVNEAYDKDIALGVQGYEETDADYIWHDICGDKIWLTDSCVYSYEEE